MSTLPQADEKNRTLSFRVTSEFWERVGIVARKQNTSIQALCTEAVEKRMDELETEQPKTSAA